MTSGYNQIIDQPTHYINESASCIDLIFSSNVNLTKNCGVEQSLYEKCHFNVIYGTLNFNIPLPLLILGNCGILKKQMLSVFKNQLIILSWLGLFKIKIATNNAKSYQKRYWIYFATAFPIKLKNLIIKLLNGLINLLHCI